MPLELSDTIISVSGLRKTFRTFKRREGVWGSVKDLFQRDYQDLKAVDDISFTVRRGEFLGYIGPNGAGKSTSIKMLTGILRPSGGEMSILGFHPFRDRRSYTRHIGVVFGQRTQLWWDIAVIESLRLLGAIYEVPREEVRSRIEKLTQILGLGELLHTPVRKLSLGQRMRCDLAASLIHEPPVLFLDEPTIGLDAVAKDSIRTFLRTINRDFGTTIILTTHDLKEIEELCKRILILDKGRVIFDGDIDRIKSLSGLERTVSVDFPGVAPREDLEKELAGRAKIDPEGERAVRISYDPKQIPTVELIRLILNGRDIADLTVSEPDIERVIMNIYRGNGV